MLNIKYMARIFYWWPIWVASFQQIGVEFKNLQQLFLTFSKKQLCFNLGFVVKITNLFLFFNKTTKKKPCLKLEKKLRQN